MGFLLMVFFVISGQPMLMVIMLMGVTVLYSLYIYFIMGSYWFSYALMLVVLSGVMVIFAYMASLSPNEMFEIFNVIFVCFFIFGIFGWKFNQFGGVMEDMSLKLWEFNFCFFNLFLVSLLLVVMVLVVWLSNLGGGAVRVSEYMMCLSKGLIW